MLSVALLQGYESTSANGSSDDEAVLPGSPTTSLPNKRGFTAVSEGLVNRLFEKGGEISGSELLCCAKALLGEAEAADLTNIQKLYKITIRELDKLGIDAEYNAARAKKAIGMVPMELCLKRAVILQESLDAITRGGRGLGGAEAGREDESHYTGHYVDLVALFGSAEFGTRRCLIFAIQPEGGYLATLWTGWELLHDDECMEQVLRESAIGEAASKPFKTTYCVFDPKSAHYPRHLDDKYAACANTAALATGHNQCLQCSLMCFQHRAQAAAVKCRRASRSWSTVPSWCRCLRTTVVCSTRWVVLMALAVPPCARNSWISWNNTAGRWRWKALVLRWLTT